jgi:hypothetical protein
MRLYHFTSSEHGLAAIRDQKYKLSTLDNLNDPFELLATDLADAKIREAFRRCKEMCARDIALLCCSKNWSSTLLWSHYADKHRGMALELEVEDECIIHVKYQKTRTPITRDDMDEYMHCEDGTGIGAEMLKIKASDWSYEDEARIFHTIGHISRPANGLYFCPFNHRISLRGVILGALCKLTDKTLQEHLPVGATLFVTKSRIAFRSFKVTKDLSSKTSRLVRGA